jgi:lipid-A-disaccharide synthase
MEVLVVAGETSGDRIAALVARALADEGVRCAGIGGAACRAAGVRTFADVGGLSAMGVGDVMRRASGLATALGRLAKHVRRARPRAALLVDYTELNQRLGRVLRARGTRVLWCVAPQVWAWRRGRLADLHASMDRLAVILPFEEALWRGAGYDATYVGHPAVPAPPIGEARNELAVLPGSRPAEVARLAGPLVDAARTLVRDGSVAAATLVLAPNVADAMAELASRRARAAGLGVVRATPELGAGPLLAGFRASLCASGTASLEAALVGASPVVTYRLDALAYALARRLVRTPHIALPNVILGRRAVPELIQDDVTPERIAEAARVVLARRDLALGLADELSAALSPPSGGTFGSRVASLLLPWLDGRSRRADL